MYGVFMWLGREKSACVRCPLAKVPPYSYHNLKVLTVRITR